MSESQGYQPTAGNNHEETFTVLQPRFCDDESTRGYLTFPPGSEPGTIFVIASQPFICDNGQDVQPLSHELLRDRIDATQDPGVYILFTTQEPPEWPHHSRKIGSFQVTPVLPPEPTTSDVDWKEYEFLPAHFQDGSRAPVTLVFRRNMGPFSLYIPCPFSKKRKWCYEALKATKAKATIEIRSVQDIFLDTTCREWLRFASGVVLIICLLLMIFAVSHLIYSLHHPLDGTKN